MPNCAAAAVLVVVAAKWRAMFLSLSLSFKPPVCAKNQARASAALAMVSWVVKVLLAMMNSVWRASSRRSTRVMSWASTLLTKCSRLAGWPKLSSAATTICGPRSLPPMPMCTMSVMPSSARTCSA